MQRTQRNVTLLLGPALVGLAVTGCFQSDKNVAKQPAAPPPAVIPAQTQVAQTPPPSNTAFAPYTVIPQLPPKPKVVTPKHGNLHLTHVNKQVVLVDGTGRVYHVGRDSHNHIYPIYREPGSNVTYPLYYDRDRDSYYRVARDDNGHYLRGYVDQPVSRYYRDDRDYERLAPSDIDQPTITNYNTYNTYDQSQPVVASAHHSNNNNWLWAIPVVIGAYYLLKPHHHSSPQPVYYGQPNRTVIVNNYYNDPNHRHDWDHDHGHPPAPIVNNYYNTAHPPHPVAWQHPVGRPGFPPAPPQQVAFQHPRPHPQRTFGGPPRPVVHQNPMVHQAAHVTTRPHPRFVLQHAPAMVHPASAKPFVRPHVQTAIQHNDKPQAHLVASAHPTSVHPNRSPHLPYRLARPAPHPVVVHVPQRNIVAGAHPRPMSAHVNHPVMHHVEAARHENRPVIIHPALMQSKTVHAPQRNEITHVMTLPRHPMSEARPEIRHDAPPIVHRDVHPVVHADVRRDEHPMPRPEVHVQQRPEVRPVVRQPRPEVRPVIHSQPRPEPHPEVRPVVHNEARPTPHEDHRNDHQNDHGGNKDHGKH